MMVLEYADDLIGASKVDHKTVEGIVSDLLYLSRVLSDCEKILTNRLGSDKKVTRLPRLRQGSSGAGAEQKRERKFRWKRNTWLR
jgi:hypothetical protein